MTAAFKTAKNGGKVGPIMRIEGKAGTEFVGEITPLKGAADELRLNEHGLPAMK